MHPKTLGALMARADKLNALMPQAKRLLELRRLLRDALPDNLARYCTVANWRQGKLVIFVQNNAIAAKLKLLRPALSKTLLSGGLEVTAMEIQVQPFESNHKQTEKHAVLTPAAAESLARLASQLVDSELRTTISKLSARKVSGR